MDKKIIICVKQVPNTSNVKIDKKTGTMIRNSVKSIINPYDETAIFYALDLKKKLKIKTIALTMGPQSANENLNYILSLGIDEAYLVSDKLFAGSDTLATSRILAETIKYINGADLILFGHQAVDGDTAQVPSQVAELLQIPSITHTTHLSFNQDKILATQCLNEKRNISCPFPAVISFLKPIPLLIHPSSKEYFKKRNIHLLSNKDLKLPLQLIGLKGSPTQVLSTFTPSFNKKNQLEKYSANWLNKIVNKIKNKI